MAAPRLSRRAVGWLVFLFTSTVATLPARGFAQQAGRVVDGEAQIVALAERLAGQLLAANKKNVFVLDLTLPGDRASPLGTWLADKISESLAQLQPELQVIPRSHWSSAPPVGEFFHDVNQEKTANENRARSLGAEVLVRGNFAAIPSGIGITLMASDALAGGNSRFESLGEIPLTPEIESRITSALPERPSVGGAYKASMAGIGAPVCELCPAPEYTYVAKAKKLAGIVILHLWVSATGSAENATIVRAPSPALGDAAIRAVRNWRFTPAKNASGESVPVVVDVAVSFQLKSKQLDAALSKKPPHTD